MQKRKINAGERLKPRPTDRVFVGGALVNRVISIETIDIATVSYQVEDADTGAAAVDSNGNSVHAQMTVQRDSVEIEE